jgi:hypothetical protein
MCGYSACVRQQPETVFPVREHELAGFACIVRDGKGLYFEIAQTKAGLSVKSVDLGQGLITQHQLSAGTEPHGHIVLPGQGAHATYMITVFVGHQYGSELRRRAPEPRHTPFGFTTGKSAVDHHQGLAGFDERCIAPAATAKRRKSHGIGIG